MITGDMELGTSGALFSDCGRYRYRLTRIFDERRIAVNFIMLNPSTADGCSDDPTIRRCQNFARMWGFGRMVVTNIYGLRSTDPKALYRDPDPIGPKNDYHLVLEALCAAEVVCAWGAHGSAKSRGGFILSLLKARGIRPVCLGRTKSGEPKHPLYLRGDTARQMA